MFDVVGEINYLAVLLAFVAFAGLGALYFLVLVPKYYVVALGRENAPAHKERLVDGLGPVVCIAVTTITSAVLMRALDVTSVTDAVVLALVVGIGYLTTMTFNIAINPNFPRPLYYGLLNAPYFIVGSVVVNLILVGLR